MITNHNIALAQDVYHFYKTRKGKWHGPDGPDLWQTEEELADATNFDLDAKLQILSNDVVWRGNRAFAPSPWHAALFLDELNTRSASRQGPSVFRGHGSTSWQFIPSIRRPNVDALASALKMKILGTLLESILFVGDIVPRAVEAAAQHYGIPTNLLDFTFDPSAAVFFATSSKEPGNGVVFHTPLLALAASACTVILPPPYVDRLYKQAGFFVEAPEDSLRSLQDACHVIEFPKYESFDYYRHGARVDMWNDSSWIQGATFATYVDGELVSRYEDNSFVSAAVRFCEKNVDVIMDLEFPDWPEEVVPEYYCFLEMCSGLHYAMHQEELFDDWLWHFGEYLSWCCPSYCSYTKAELQRVYNLLAASNRELIEFYRECSS